MTLRVREKRKDSAADESVLGPKLLLVMGCVKLGNQFAVCSLTEGKRKQIFLPSFTQPMGSNNFRPSTDRHKWG